jgi:hypothetical protein
VGGFSTFSRTLAIPFDPNPVEHGIGEDREWVEIGPNRHVLKRKDETIAEHRNKTRKHDSKHFGGVFTGCTMRQRDEFNRRFGRFGVKYVPHGDTGVCRSCYDDIRAQKRVAKERGQVCFSAEG